MAVLLNLNNVLVFAVPVCGLLVLIKKYVYDALPPRLPFPVYGTPEDKDLSPAMIKGFSEVSSKNDIYVEHP